MRHLVVLLIALASACGVSRSPIGLTAQSDARVDADALGDAALSDAAIDAGLDATLVPDRDASIEAGTDASLVVDASTDASDDASSDASVGLDAMATDASMSTDAAELDASGNDAGSDASTGADAGYDASIEDDAGEVCVASNEICDGIDNDCNAVIDDDAACPPGCTAHATDAGRFLYCATALNWGRARTACREHGFELVAIMTPAENAAVASLVGSGAWIGATDNVDESVFAWSSGEPFGFSNWAPSQPDDAGGIEDCVQMLSDGTWNDLPCGVGASRPYVCE